MVIDSSALIALLLAESETPAFVEAIAAVPRRLVGAPSYLETAIVMISRLGPELDRLLVELRIEIVPFTQDQAALAIAAFQRYGKGTGHAAGLNFGDCFSYALAKHFGEPILFKGNDFSQTDLVIAAAP
jgi:ribonuclease VapC